MLARAPASTVPLRPGSAAQTWDTLRLMRQVARSSALLPPVIAYAHNIAAEQPDLDGHDQRALAAALRAHLERRIRYLPDPAVTDTETIRTPLYMLAELEARGHARGDCDDVATLAASLATALGVRSRLIALAWGGVYAHVYAAPLELEGIDWDVTARGREGMRAASSGTMYIDV